MLRRYTALTMGREIATRSSKMKAANKRMKHTEEMTGWAASGRWCLKENMVDDQLLWFSAQRMYLW